jgi:hypothetical protein
MNTNFEWDKQKIVKIKENTMFHLKQHNMPLRIPIVL